ncbi:hypothetical protein RADP37_05551 [Roseomonas mucosa]|uniref:Uncharacterized protein n=1 Tax=Roseomonas mucosa TaxID=207340 RepID=A0A4Y1N0N1_9PROT|nr:hypothetical protein RADP37_05551 [Roseomonas mucosa]
MPRPPTRRATREGAAGDRRDRRPGAPKRRADPFRWAGTAHHPLSGAATGPNQGTIRKRRARPGFPDRRGIGRRA